MKRRSKTSPAARAFKKVKLQSISTLKKKADAIISKYVRQKAANEAGQANCYTCSGWAEWKSLQAGHFIPRNISATRYSLDNLRVQCVGCNVWGRGRIGVFADQLLQELGTARFKALLARGRITHQFTRAELLDIIEKYTLS